MNSLRRLKNASRQSSVRPEVERLEDRWVPAVTATLNKTTGVLTVQGTAMSETIEVTQQGGKISVSGLSISVKSPGPPVVKRATVASSAVTLVRVNAGAGADLATFRTLTSLDPTANVGNRVIKAELSGGDGDDVLKGDSGADLLVGGAGCDDLDAGSGADRLFGDSLYAGVSRRTSTACRSSRARRTPRGPETTACTVGPATTCCTAASAATRCGATTATTSCTAWKAPT